MPTKHGSIEGRFFSFNFTKAAEQKNARNLLIIRDKTLAAKYIKDWKEHVNHSEDYDKKAR